MGEMKHVYIMLVGTWKDRIVGIGVGEDVILKEILKK